MNASEQLPQPDRFLSKPSTRRDWLLFAAGFLGWYLVNGLLWFLMAGGSFDTEAISGEGILGNILIFPLNVIALLIFAAIRETRRIGLGILAALVVNLAFSLVMSVLWNGVCFIPFFIKY